MNTNTHNKAHELQWKAPVLYKEEWMNTLSGSANPTPEVDEFDDGPVPPPSS